MADFDRTDKITLGGVETDIGPIPFGRLRRVMHLVPAGISWVATADNYLEFMRGSPDGLEVAAELIAASLGKDVAAVEAMCVTVAEAMMAIVTIARLNNLLPVSKEGPPLGEATAGTSTGD